jgi:hypothetical protein
MVIASLAGIAENSSIRNEVRCISYGPYNLVLHGALVLSLLTAYRDLKGHGLVLLDVVGQLNGREASPAEFVLDTVPAVEHPSDVKRAVQAFPVPYARLSIRLYLALIIGIDEIAKVAAVGDDRDRCKCHCWINACPAWGDSLSFECYCLVYVYEPRRDIFSQG